MTVRPTSDSNFLKVLTNGPDEKVLTFCDQETIFKMGLVCREWQEKVSSYFRSNENVYPEEIRRLISEGLGISVGKLPILVSKSAAAMNPAAIHVTYLDPIRTLATSLDMRSIPVARWHIDGAHMVIINLQRNLQAFEGRLWIGQNESSKTSLGDYSFTSASSCGSGSFTNAQIVNILRGKDLTWKICRKS